MKTYVIWFKNYGESPWSKTNHYVKARSDKEAQSRMLRKFQGSGFHSMFMLALEEGVSPS